MPQKSQSLVSKSERLASNEKMKHLLWDDIKIFLACIGQDSFRKAGNVLGVSASTITRRIEHLESLLGSVLFYRLPEGIGIRPEGELILESAKKIQQQVVILVEKTLNYQSNYKKSNSDNIDFITNKIDIEKHVQELSWDELKIFMAFSRENSFRKAAKILSCSPATVQRRINNLEDTIEEQLLIRNHDESTITEFGNIIIEDIREIEQSIYDIIRQALTMENDLSGEVNISITEGLGSYWVVPEIAQFKKVYPGVNIKLNCAMENADVLRMEADVSIQLNRPEDQDLIIQKIAKLHVYPFAAESYIETYGKPEKGDDLKKHSFVKQEAPHLDNDALSDYLQQDISSNTSLKTNASTAHFNAVAKGVGIGVLPSYAIVLGMPVVPLDIVPLPYSLDIWLTYQKDTKKVKRNEVVIKWLKDIFDPQTHPWFRDQFIHPSDLQKKASNIIKAKSVRSFYIDESE